MQAVFLLFDSRKICTPEADIMRKCRDWKRCINCRIYRLPRLNKRLVCIRRSLDELCEILNQKC